MWAEAVTEYLAEYEGLTRQRYAESLDAFRDWYLQCYAEEPDAALLTREEVREYRNALTRRGLKAGTVNARLTPLRGLVRSLGRELKVRGLRQVVAPVESLSARELGRLLAAVEGERWQDKRNLALLTLLARAGLRVSEALHLTLADVTLGERSGQCLIREGKGGKERRVPLGKEIRSVLRAYLGVRPQRAVSDLIFISRTYAPLSPRDVQRLITSAARIAGLAGKRVTPHTLRHTFATRFLQQNPGDLATLAQILGHTAVSTTTRYLHPNAARIREMLEDL